MYSDDFFTAMLSNPQALAGLAMMRGASPFDALTQAAMAVQQNRAAQMEQQNAAKAQYLQQALPEIIQGLDPQNPQEALSKLAAAGISPQEGALILERLGVGGRGKGRAGLSAGAETSAGLPLNNNELKVFSNTLQTFDNQARSAEKELRLLEDSEKAFNEFDKNTGNWTGAGGALTRSLSFLPKVAENAVYNKNAQTAKQEIDKLNSQLFQNRVMSLGPRATDAAKEQIVKGLPTTELNPAAREDVLKTKKRENFEQILRSRFFSEWSRLHGKDLNGAEAAFSDFLESVPLLDERGKINKNAISEIQNFIGQSSNKSQITTSASPVSPKNNIDQFRDISLEALLAEREARKRR